MSQGRGRVKGGYEGVMGVRWNVHSALKIKMTSLVCPVFYEERGNKGEPICKFSIARKTSGLEVEEDAMCLARARSKAPITMGSRQMAVSRLSKKVSMESLHERASAGAIFVPGVICQMMLKSCKNSDQHACHLDNFQGSLT